MTQRFAHRLMFVILLICQFSISFTTKAQGPNDTSKYLDAVREFANNVLKDGRDIWGPKHTPLFVDGLNIHTLEPVKWIAPNGDRWILSNLASQQNLFRTLDGLTKITGDPKYKQAAMDAIKYAFENLRSPSGLLHWGGHQAYDIGSDNPCGRWVHENKGFYPHYQLMWEVNPTATKQFIESFWSGHIRDWSNLDMDRHCYEMSQTLEKAWKHKYKGGPVFFKPKQGIPASFNCTAGALVHGAVALTKISGDGEPLVWAKRLIRRYVDTRDPKTGIGASRYTGEQKKVPTLQEMKDLDFNVFGYNNCFPTIPTYGNSEVQRCWYGYCTMSPGIPFNMGESPWICALLVGEMMGSEGREFIQWSVEELTAWGKVAYRKSDNSWIPMLRDGTSLEGLVIKRGGPFGPEGTVVVPISVIPMDFWAYSVAYRLTGNDFMWQMVRDIALGNNFGDIGIASVNLPEFYDHVDCADPYALMGFLELYRKTQRKLFLVRAKQIGDNILNSRFHKGFFAPSNKYFYARFDSPESLALLHLHESSLSGHAEVPTMWPSHAFFEHAFRDKEPWDDNSLIYRLTESPEPPISLQEAAAIGDLDLIKTLIEKGVEVDSREDSFFKTALHRAAMSGHKEAVDLLLNRGANIDARSSGVATALHYTAEQGHKEIAELLIGRGADINATNSTSDTPLHSATRAGHRDIVELLIAKGADVNARNDEGQTPVDVALSRDRNEVVKLLIAKGADVSLHIAVRVGALVKVKSLIEKGTNISEKDASGQTALHYAVEYGHEDVVKLLIANGADVNAKDKDGNAPGHVALKKDRNAVLDLLIAKGANLTSIHLSAYQGDLDKVTSFIEKETDVSAMDSYGATPLHYAAVRGNEEVVEFLIARGVDVNAKNKSGETPLHRAAIAGHKDVVELLIDNAANINATEQRNYTPMHYAVWLRNTETAEFLIAKGADVQAKDRWGWTPLHYAVDGGNREMAELLIAGGADVNAKDMYGETPLPIAKDKGYTEIVELLRKHISNLASTTIGPKSVCISQDGTIGLDEIFDLTLTGPANEKSHYGKYPRFGDVNGDGYEDLLVAGGNRFNNNQGRIYLYYGGADFDNTADKIFTGENENTWFGEDGFLGDVNGDGYDDVITVASAENNIHEGRVYIFFGGSDMDENADLILDGKPGIQESFGHALIAGDFNKDGYDDVVVAATGFNNITGRVYLFYGGDPMDTTVDLIFDGENEKDRFGRDINNAKMVGDVNGDGYNDLLISTRTWNFWEGVIGQGRAYLYYGGPGTSMDSTPDKIFTGENEKDDFGVSGCIFDIDNDGFDDVIIGARGYKGRGRVYLYWGGQDMDTIADQTFDGERNSQFGCGLDAGYVNDDDYGDIIVAAPYYSGKPWSGKAYLFYGDTKARINATCDKTFILPTDTNNWPQKIALGDLHNDNYPDLAIGGCMYNDLQGRVWIYFNKPPKSK